MTQTQVSPVARHVIQKCGGAKVVQRITGRAIVTIHKWSLPKPAGCGGLIPTECQQLLMDAARRGEVNLEPADFFERTA
jgi:hypothetical protein